MRVEERELSGGEIRCEVLPLFVTWVLVMACHNDVMPCLVTEGLKSFSYLSLLITFYSYCSSLH